MEEIQVSLQQDLTELTIFRKITDLFTYLNFTEIEIIRKGQGYLIANVGLCMTDFTFPKFLFKNLNILSNNESVIS